MNNLSYQITNNNDFSIELLVDGKIIDGLENADVKAIPYWLFEMSDLPKWCPYPHNKDVTILGVCSCGEVGCGSAGCVVVKNKKEVIFKEIFIDGFQFPNNFQYTFSRENYEAMIKDIIVGISKFKVLKTR